MKDDAPREDKPAMERRAFPRRPVSCRSAVWFDEGPSQGVIGTIVDLSMSGFSVRLLTAPAEGFKSGATIYCVLLIQGAHLDCLATFRSLVPLASGESQAGFSFEALSDDNSRLLAGLVRRFEEPEDGRQPIR